MNRGQLLRVAKALADPTRFNILQSIASTEEICCGELANQFSIAQATVSHHLKILLESGLINVRREGQFNYCSLVRNTIDTYRFELGAVFDFCPGQTEESQGGQAKAL